VSDERARLFVALELPDHVREALAEWRTSVPGRDGRLRLVPPDALHVTLCFLGWRAVGEIEQIAAACSAVSAAAPVELSLGEPVWLPRRRPSVLAVELVDGADALAQVQASLSAALQAGGWYVPESRPFLAHVTVARVGKGGRAPRDRLSTPPAIRFTGSVVTLYRSRLGAAGARYERLSSVSLGSGTAPALRDPVSVVRAFHVAQAQMYAGGDLDSVRSLLSEDVVWHVPGRSAIAGEHAGIDAVLGYFDLRRRLTDQSFKVTIHGAALIADRVVQLAGGRAVRDGRSLEWETAGVFRVVDGRIAECWLVPFDQYAFDEIWS
jgi:RNA 2',3'-cyclic 3'-phosphodiesterase